jgi:hypothetical protein
MSESALQAAILDALNRAGCIATANVVCLHRGRPTGLGTGSPDVYVIVPPNSTVWLEVKTPDKASKLSQEQIDLHARWRRGGVRIEVVRSVTEALAVVAEIRRVA